MTIVLYLGLHCDSGAIATEPFDVGREVSFRRLTCRYTLHSNVSKTATTRDDRPVDEQSSSEEHERSRVELHVVVRFLRETSSNTKLANSVYSELSTNILRGWKSSDGNKSPL